MSSLAAPVKAPFAAHLEWPFQMDTKISAPSLAAPQPPQYLKQAFVLRDRVCRGKERRGALLRQELR